MSGAFEVVPAKVRAPRVHALRRERLTTLLGRLWEHRLGLVIGPAGSGKTTLLADFAADVAARVAWYRAESWDGEVVPLLEHLRLAFRDIAGRADGAWKTVETAARALEDWRGGRILLVVDDLHALEGTPAEAALERLVDYAPESLAVLAGSRTVPRFNLSRLRVSGRLLEVGSEELRFRSWEAERLFRDIYGLSLPPEDLAELTRRTEGWAAGLQLFHLAVRGKTASDARRLLASLGSRSRLQREYLTRNVLGDLPEELRTFLLETFVLTRLSGPICDRFLDVRGSARILQELERRQIFTHEVDAGTYRYHEVLRRHLEALLIEETGEAALRERYRRAGGVLEEEGALNDALGAYSRGGDWDAVRRMLEAQGRVAVHGDQEWVALAPASVVENDPWLLLTLARRRRAEGRWADAVRTYQEAERSFGGGESQAICVRERVALTPWLEPGPQPSAGMSWAGLVRAATVRDPSSVLDQAARLAEPERSLALGLAALAAGRIAAARPALARASESPAASPTRVGGRLAAAVAGLLGSGAGSAATLEGGIDEAETLGLLWLAHAGRAALALVRRPHGVDDAVAGRVAFEAAGNAWGVALARLCECWGLLLLGEDARAVALEAERCFRTLGAPVLEAWALALNALAAARVGDPMARTLALAAERTARSRGCLGARLLAQAALAESDPAGGEHRELVAALAEQTGLQLPRPVGHEEAAGQDAVQIRCLGSFSFARGGRDVDLSSLKPRARALLRLLAVNAGALVHREALQEALWPGAPVGAGSHNLQVAVSSLRQVLEPGVARGEHALLVRDGEAYRLALGPGSAVDFMEFENGLSRAREPAPIDARISAYRAALALYAGDLLPEDGPSEWVVGHREHLRAEAVAGQRELAELLLEAGDAGDAIEAARAGLRLDRYQDGLWKLLIEALDQYAGTGAASRARAQYRSMLSELGVTSTEPVRT